MACEQTPHTQPRSHALSASIGRDALVWRLLLLAHLPMHDRPWWQPSGLSARSRGEQDGQGTPSTGSHGRPHPAGKIRKAFTGEVGFEQSLGQASDRRRLSKWISKWRSEDEPRL